jgi:LysR family positive regulator for ilvC
MVSMGCGVGIVPRLVLEKSSLRDEVGVLQISPQLKPFTVAACTILKNIENPIVQSFWNIVQKEMAERIEE